MRSLHAAATLAPRLQCIDTLAVAAVVSLHVSLGVVWRPDSSPASAGGTGALCSCMVHLQGAVQVCSVFRALTEAGTGTSPASGSKAGRCRQPPPPLQLPPPLWLTHRLLPHINPLLERYCCTSAGLRIMCSATAAAQRWAAAPAPPLIRACPPVPARVALQAADVRTAQQIVCHSRL